MTVIALSKLAKRRQPQNATRLAAVRRSQIRRLTLALRDAGRMLTTNRAGLAAVVNDLAPGTDRPPRVGPVSAAIVSFSHPGRCRQCRVRQAHRGPAPRGTQQPNPPPPAQPGRGPGAEQHDPHLRGRAPGCENDPAIRAYVTCCIAEGKSKREI